MRWKQYPLVSISHPKAVLGAFFAFLVACSVILLAYPKVDIDPTFNNMIMPNDPDRAPNEAQKLVFGDDEYMVVAVESPDTVFNVETLAKIYRITQAVLRIDGVRDVYSLAKAHDIRTSAGGAMIDTSDLMTEPPTTPAEVARIEKEAFANPTIPRTLVSDDKKVASINIELATTHIDVKARSAVIDQIKDVVGAETKTGNEKLHFAGFPYASNLSGTMMIGDMLIFSLLCGGLLIIIMWLIHRNLQGVIASMFVAFVAVAGTYALATVMGVKISMPLSSMMVFVIALAMEYAIYVAFAYTGHMTDEVERGRKVRDFRLVLSEATWSVSGAVTISAVTTSIGFLSMWSNPVPELSKMGWLMAFGTVLAGFGALTILPAFGSMWPVPVDVTKRKRSVFQAFLVKLADSSVRRPWLHLTIALLIGAWGVGGWMQLDHETDAMQYFRPGASIRKDETFMRERMSGTTMMPVVIEGKSPEFFKEPKNLAMLEDIERYALTLPNVTYAVSHADHLKLMNRAMHGDSQAFYKLPDSRATVEQYLVLHGKPEQFRPVVSDDYSSAAIQLRLNTMSSSVLKMVETDIEAYAKSHYPEATTNALGTTLLVHRAFDVMATSMLFNIAQAMLAIWIVLIIVFRSLKLGTLALIPNAIPIILNYGFLGWVGHSLDPPASVTGCIALGIAVDDTIHYFKWWQKEMMQHTASSAEAVRSTMHHNGRAMVFSSLVLASAFGVMAFSQYGTLVWIGIMMSVTTVNALLCDLLVTPTLLRLVTNSLPVPDAKKALALITRPFKQTITSPERNRFSHYSDDEIRQMHTYDVFGIAGKSVIRHGWLAGTRRLLHELDLKPGMRVLEIGVGSGASAMVMAKAYGVEVFGVDISEYCVHKAIKTAIKNDLEDQCHFVTANAMNLPFHAASFDAVVMEGLAAYTNTCKLFGEAHRVLKPGGRIGFHDWCWALEVPPANLVKLTDLVGCSCPAGSLSFYTRAGWTEQVKSCDFDIKFSEQFPFCFFGIKQSIDDEGLWGVIRMFARMMARKAALLKALDIITFLGKYEGWFGYTLCVGEKAAGEGPAGTSPA